MRIGGAIQLDPVAYSHVVRYGKILIAHVSFLTCLGVRGVRVQAEETSREMLGHVVLPKEDMSMW